MIIIDKITVKLNKLEKINDRIIYLADLKIIAEKKSIRQQNGRKYIKKTERDFFLKNVVYCKKHKNKENEKYFLDNIRTKLKLSKEEDLIIKEVILKKEIGCSTYE